MYICSFRFPKQYPNNAECTWEIMADNGYHIGLSFVNRFNLESSTNCEKDFIQVRFSNQIQILNTYLTSKSI